MSSTQTGYKKHIVELCQHGDREAQGILYSTYKRKMMRVIRRYVADNDLAQDILHDGFLIVLSQIQTLRNPDKLEYWMATIMKNLAIHSLYNMQFDNILEEDIEEETDENEISFDDILEFIEQLPNGYRTVFKLAVLKGRSHKEIGEMLGISPKSSASQLARAKEKLRQLIIEHKRQVAMLSFFGIAIVSCYVYYIIGLRQATSPIVPSPIIKPQETVQLTENKVEGETVMSTKSNLNAMTSMDYSIDNFEPNKDTLFIAVNEQIANDTITGSEEMEEQTDSIMVMPHKGLFNPDLSERDLIATHTTANDDWKVSISSNMIGFASNQRNTGIGNSMSDPSMDYEQKKEESSTSARHLMPITFGIRVSKSLSPSLTIESGMQYSLLSSDITNTIGNWSYVQNVRANFIAIPVSLRYKFLERNLINTYISSGLSLNIPVSASSDSKATDEHTKLNYPVCLLLTGGFGIEYKVSSSASIFIEPSINYHIMKETSLPILWQDKPFSFDLPIGVRFSW